MAHFMFNLGPNTLTFILAAEIFPTEVRGTSYGVAAASGKLGALIARAIIKGAGKSKTGLVVVLSVFSAVLATMAILVQWEPIGIAFPPVQKPRRLGWRLNSLLQMVMNSKLENKSLEDISPWPPARSETITPPPDGGVGTTGNGAVRSASVSDSEPRASREVQEGISLEAVRTANNASVDPIGERGRGSA
jgi:hypothetical protein